MRRVAIALLLLGAGCFDEGPEGQPRLGRMGKLFGGAEGLDAVESPDRVEAFRLRPPSPGQEIAHYNEWPVVGAPVRVPSDVASHFSKGLTRESTYPRWEEPKTCDPRPGFMLRFTGSGRSVDVVFCFECQILFTYRASEPIWYANFDGSTKVIAGLLLQIFPKDPVLTSLAAKSP
jgi:hypothetical protein